MSAALEPLRIVPPRLRRPLFWLYVVLALAYLVWRALCSLNPEWPIYSGLFYAMELASILAAIVFYAYLVAPRAERQPPPPADGLLVDVLIATYDEETDLLRTTAVAARDMDYPHRTWICDDGRRPEVEQLARELGVGYITRPENRHFKAGNLNHALSQTDGDLVLVLDADHVPRRQLLVRTLGYFGDPEVALVQCPQVYYNLDSYQHVLSLRRRRLWHEAAVFHHLMQPGAEHHGASFFVGTGAILRRTALEAIGGFATGTITEDIHTSMRLHAAGYRSVYVDEALGYMLAADTPAAYLLQRMRWAQGSMQILRRENPLWKRGLRPWQRIGYLNAMGVYLLAFQQLVFYLAPSIYLLGGVSPIAVDQPGALAIFAGYIALALALYKLLAAPYARLFLGECFKMINLSTFMLASLTLIKPQGLRFRVTPKGSHGGLPWPLLVVPVALLLANLTATGVGLTRALSGAELHWGALSLTMIFAGGFSIAGAVMLFHTFVRRYTDEPFLYPVLVDGTLTVAECRLGVRVDRMNQRHAIVRCDEELPLLASARFELGTARLGSALPVEVVGATAAGRQRVYRLALGQLPLALRNELDRFFFEFAMPRFLAVFHDAPAGPAPDARSSAAAAVGIEPPKHTEDVLVSVRPGLL